MLGLKKKEFWLFELLEEKYNQYQQNSFIETDPIQIPHLFSKKEDIEISGFLTATIAWGQRASIIKNAQNLMKAMDLEPYHFIMFASKHEIKSLAFFKHRTFFFDDLQYFIYSLRNIYQNHHGLERVFSTKQDAKERLIHFRKTFFELEPPKRTFKHISDVEKNSAAKRLHMFLRWMVRKHTTHIDFGIWNQIHTNQLICPLDVHSGNVARKLNILSRKQNDWQAAYELTENLKIFDPIDPVKYDYALFGLGAFEKF